MHTIAFSPATVCCRAAHVSACRQRLLAQAGAPCGHQAPRHTSKRHTRLCALLRCAPQHSSAHPSACACKIQLRTVVLVSGRRQLQRCSSGDASAAVAAVQVAIKLCRAHVSSAWYAPDVRSNSSPSSQSLLHARVPLCLYHTACVCRRGGTMRTCGGQAGGLRGARWQRTSWMPVATSGTSLSWTGPRTALGPILPQCAPHSY